MKKILLASSVALAMGFGVPTAMADDGEVTITGEIVASACTVDPSSQNMTVVLPTATPASFGNAAGILAGRTRFTINLTNCTPGTYTNVTTAFSGAFDPSYPNVLKNTAPTASAAGNVGVRLLTADDTPININSGVGVDTPIVTGAMALDFLAAYESTAASGVTVGDVKAVTTFTIGYN